MRIEFDKPLAQKTDSNFIDHSGIFKGEFTKAVEKQYQSGSICISFNFKSDDGGTAKYLQIFVVKKNGEKSFGYNQIQSLMGLLQIRTAETMVHDNGDQNYDIFCGKKIAIALQRVNTPNQDYPFKLKLLHFLDYNTMQNYNEKSNNKPAEVFKREIKDDIDDTASVKKDTFDYGAPAIDDNDLPF